MHLPHCVIGQEFIVLQIPYFAPPYFITGVWNIDDRHGVTVYSCEFYFARYIVALCDVA